MAPRSRALVVRASSLSQVLLVSMIMVMRQIFRSQPELEQTAPLIDQVPVFQLATPTNGTVPRRYEEFSAVNCSSPERFRALQSKPFIKFVTAKFGYGGKFKDEVLMQRQRAIDSFAWLGEENAVGMYEIPDRWRQDFPNHTQFLDNPGHESATGGGWWFWKSVVILEELEALQDGDLLFYADNDQLALWMSALSDFLWYMMEHPQYDWALPRWGGGCTEEVFTKYDVFVAHCGSANIDRTQLRKAFHSTQFEAGIHVIRNSPKTRQFARQWKSMTINYHAISDEPSYLPNYAGFQEHRRDQSLLNLLIKCTYRVGLAFTRVPHSCGWLNGPCEIDFTFLKLPFKKSDNLIAIQKKTSTKWAELRDIHEIKSVTTG